MKKTIDQNSGELFSRQLRDLSLYKECLHNFKNALPDNWHLKVLENILEGEFAQLHSMGQTEFYCHNILVYYARLIACVERLSHVNVFIETFPRPVAYFKKGITIDMWIEYHTSVFYSNISTLNDLIFLMTNTVFEIGLDPKHCKPEILLSSDHLNDTELGKSLRAMHSTLQRYVAIRNLDMHRAQSPKMPNKELNKKHILVKFINTFARDDQIVNERVNGHGIQNGLDLSREFNDVILKISPSIIKVLNELYAHFKTRIGSKLDSDAFINKLGITPAS